MRWSSSLVGLSLALLLPVMGKAAEQFDYYINPVLSQAIEEKKVKEVPELKAEELTEYHDVLGDTSAVVLVVLTNGNRNAKLLIRAARQKIGTDQLVPILLVEKYVTYKEATERTIKAKGENVQLYAGTRLHLDLGQVVPEKLGGDLLVTESATGGLVLKPVGKAKLHVLTQPIPGVVPKKGSKLVMGAQFDPRYFIGTYKLHDDGRRSGQLKLEVNESGEVTGAFYSDRDGAKYDVFGKIGNPKHTITFTIKFPQTEQSFRGHMFTGNGKFIAGTSKLQEREGGFFAERLDE